MPAVTPLKRILLAEGRRQNWLAEQAGVDTATLSKIANRGMLPTAAQAEAIARVLGRDLSELGWDELRSAA